MITSRGCPYSCNFCQVNIYYLNQVRFRSVDNVLQEIDEIVNKFKIREINFRDQTLTINRDRLLSICHKIIEKRYKIFWRCFSCVDTVDEELLTAMKKAGCYQICYGFENGSQRVLDLSGKGITLQQAIKAAHLTKKAGIEISGAFMLGMYGDTKESIQKTIDFACELDCDYVQFQLATPFYSTEFYDLCIRNKFNCIEPEELRWYSWKTMDSISLSHEMLQRKLKDAYRKFYFRLPYIYKAVMKIKGWRNFFVKIKAAFSLLTEIIK